jgi:hypothetical protein
VEARRDTGTFCRKGAKGFASFWQSFINDFAFDLFIETVPALKVVPSRRRTMLPAVLLNLEGQAGYY